MRRSAHAFGARAWALVAVAMVGALLGVACGKQERCRRDIVDRAWTEDVRLDDGSTVRVRRTATLRITNSWVGDNYNAVELDATLVFADGQKSLPVWSAQRIAMVLYRDAATREWVLVTTTTSCQIWERNGKPKPPYWEYRLRENGWQQVPLSAASIGRPANLLHVYDKELPDRIIRDAEREQLQGDKRIAREYREIWGDPDQFVCGEGNPSK
ncbi:MAG: hypothetical protein U1F30_09025 [Steroidobacteraceae bacterium]